MEKGKVEAPESLRKKKKKAGGILLLEGEEVTENVPKPFSETLDTRRAASGPRWCDFATSENPTTQETPQNFCLAINFIF